jgi:CubicO group peptidase (beta-lactamase class C family)
LRQLATHTSGITDRWSVYESTYHYGGDAKQELGEFLMSYFTTDGKHYARDNFLNAKPGSHREYSNIGAGLAGYIVELVTREKLSEYTKQRIFTPLKMDNTGWFFSDIPSEKHSQLYVAQNGMSVPIQLYGITTYPDGGVRTSVSDLSRLFVALLNDGEYQGARVLDKKSAREMLRFQYTESNKPINVSLQKKNSGIFWQSMFDVTRMGHGGSDPGLKTDMLTDLSGKVGVIVFVNTSLGDEEMTSYNDIFKAVWDHAEKLAADRQQAQIRPR